MSTRTHTKSYHFDSERCLLTTPEGRVLDLGAHFASPHEMPQNFLEAMQVYRALRDGNPIPRPSLETIARRRLRAAQGSLGVNALEKLAAYAEHLERQAEREHWKRQRAGWHAFCAASESRVDA